MAHFLFSTALIFISYTYVIYPAVIVCIAYLTKRRPVPDAPGIPPPTVTMLIVAYNEEATIARKLDNCARLNYPPGSLEIVVVSDGSTDDTNEICRRRADITFVEGAENLGKPRRINDAVAACDSDIILFSDARQLYEPDAVSKIVRNFLLPDVGCVSGELVLRPADDRSGGNIGLYWRYEKLLRKAESRVDSTFGATGAIYAIRRDLFSPIPEDTILDDIEIPLGAFRRGRRIVFDQEAVASDPAAASIETEFGRKVRTLAGNYQIFARNGWLFHPLRNRIFFQMVSHKVFRLLIPYALVIMLLTTPVLGGRGSVVFFALQLVCYAGGIATLKYRTLRGNRILNFLSVFIALNAAAVVALYRYLTRRADIRWKR